MSRYTFSTDDPTLAAKALALFSNGEGTFSNAGPIADARQASLPVAAPAPAPVAAQPAPAPVQQVAPPAAAEAPAGWTIDHVRSALAALAASKGPAAVKALLEKHGNGVATLQAVPAASWPALYADATA